MRLRFLFFSVLFQAFNTSFDFFFLLLPVGLSCFLLLFCMWPVFFLLLFFCVIRRSDNDFHTYYFICSYNLTIFLCYAGTIWSPFSFLAFKNIWNWFKISFFNFSFLKLFLHTENSMGCSRHSKIRWLLHSNYLKWLRKWDLAFVWVGSWWMWFMRHIGIQIEHT